MKVFTFLILLVAAMMASDAVVSGAWVYEHQKQQGVVIVDVSSPEVYAKSHIPGAMNAPFSNWRKKVGKHAVVLPVEALQKEMRRLGINNDSRVIVYSHQATGKDLLTATYVIWAMEYAGFKNSALLEGGMQAYVDVTRILSKRQEADRSGTFTAREDASILATMKMVEAAIGTVPMIDSRPAVFYFGAEKQKPLGRAGHISSAHSYFWAYSIKPDNTFKSEAQLRDMLEEGLGLDKNAPLIVYCTGGREASMNYFVLHRILGFDKVKLYDASMKEWANRTDTPMTEFRWE